MNYAFCGDRQISVDVLRFIIRKGYYPSILIVNDSKTSTHSKELIAVSELDEVSIIYSSNLKKEESVELLKNADLDYIIGIHFPIIIPKIILDIPKVGFLNLHPAYLPYNKGWHTPSWAITDGTPYGATLHFMSEVLDSGDIIHQKKIEVKPSDTANSLYAGVLKLEYDVFVEAFDDLLTLNPRRLKQTGEGTSYSKNDLKSIQKIDLNSDYKASELIDKMRALTTNKLEESAYFIKNNKKYYIQLSIVEELEDKKMGSLFMTNSIYQKKE